MKTHLRQSALLVILLAAFVLNCKKDEPVSTPFVVKSVTPISGVVGAKVVLVGTGFSAVPGEMVVMFGDVNAVLDSVTTTRIVTSIPQGARTGKLIVKVGDKTLTSSTDFIITVNPPVFDTTASANGASNITKISATTTSTLTAKGDDAITQYGHVWSKADGTPTTADSKTELGAFPLTATFPFKITSTLKELEPGVTYTIRAYATAAGATTYGPVFKLKTVARPADWGNVKIKADFPGESRSSPKLFTVNNKLYVFGGGRTTTNSSSCLNDLWQFDPQTNKWTAKATIPVSCNHNLNASTPVMIFGDEVCFVVYRVEQYKSYVYAYNTATDKWTTKKVLPFFDTNGTATFTIGTKGYLIGGSTSGPANKNVWEYDYSSDTWLKKNNFPGEARNNSSGKAYDGKGYIIGGWPTSVNQETWMYDASNDSWQQKKSHSLSSRTFWGNEGFIKGEELFFVGINTYYKYNFSSDTWSEVPIPEDIRVAKNYESKCGSVAGFTYSVQNVGGKLYMFFQQSPSLCASLISQLWEYTF